MKFFLHFKTLLFIIIIGITFVSCNYKDVEIANIEKIKLGKIKSNYISLDTRILINNPNNYKIKIKKYNLDVVVNKQNFKMVEADANIIIPKKYNGTISVPITMKSKDLLNFRTITTMYKLFTSKKVDVETHGTISIKFLFFSKKIKINEKKTIDL